MKLLYSTSLQYFVITIFVLSLSGTLLYFWMQKQIVDEVREQLDFEITMIEEELFKGNNISFPFVSIQKLDRLVGSEVVFGDTLVYDVVQKEMEGYYYMEKVKTINNDIFRIKVMTTFIGWKQYANMIFSMFLIGGCLLCLLGLFLNHYSNKKLWNPFFSNLALLRTFSVRSDRPVEWKRSKIAEFSLLESTLSEMTENSRREYIMLKEFTENASHEIQTPISIMRASLERLSQFDMDKDMSSIIVDAKSALDRLSKVNRKLLFLAKLENNFYVNKTEIDLSQLINDKVHLMEDLYHQKDISLSLFLYSELNVQADMYLMESLVMNLLSNILKYTPRSGKASVRIVENKILFSNEGNELPFSPERIFERFKKGTDDQRSNGLGLSIVKQICEINGWVVSYNYHAGKHIISIHL